MAQPWTVQLGSVSLHCCTRSEGTLTRQRALEEATASGGGARGAGGAVSRSRSG